MAFQDLIGLIVRPTPKTQLQITIEEIEYEAIYPPVKIEHKIKRGKGRPTVITKEVLVKLREGFMMGFSNDECAAFVGIGTRTLYDYLAIHKEFSQYIEAWKQNPILRAKNTIYHNLDDAENAKWYLERKRRDEFATRKELTGGDGDSAPIKLEYVIPKSIPRAEGTISADTETT